MITKDKTAVALSVFTDLMRVNKDEHVNIFYSGNSIDVTAFYRITDDNITIDREEIESAYNIQGTGIIQFYTTEDCNDFQTLSFKFENN